MPLQLGKLPIYNGAWDCAVKTVKKEGFFGLYKGIILYYYFFKNLIILQKNNVFSSLFST